MDKKIKLQEIRGNRNGRTILEQKMERNVQGDFAIYERKVTEEKEINTSNIFRIRSLVWWKDFIVFSQEALKTDDNIRILDPVQ